MPFGEKVWIGAYERAGALWIHDGNPQRPHAKLSSGKHSNGFFNSELVMEVPFNLDLATAELVEKASSVVDLMEVDSVNGPAMGAITVAHDIARHIARATIGSSNGLRRNNRPLCRRVYTEKKSDADKEMAFKRTSIKPGESVLLCEDVLTTGGSVASAARAVESAGGAVLPFVLALVNRTGATEVGGRAIIALIDRHMPIWEPCDCPLCQQGSEAIKPKEAENWSRLNAQYPAAEHVVTGWEH